MGCPDNHFIGIIPNGHKKSAWESDRYSSIDDIKFETHFVYLVILFEALHLISIWPILLIN